MNDESKATLAHAQGCLLGALIGDAAGAVLEFLGREPTRDEVAAALTLSGGGVWRVAPGQITDDGELTLALARALAGADRYPVEEVARNYLRWLRSKPFDVGNATANAMDCEPALPDPLHAQMTGNASKHNMASKANGALMRSSPLGIWSTGSSFEEAVAAARSDAQLSHPNASCQWANAAYVCALRHLVMHPGEADEAYGAALSAVEMAPANDPGAQEVRSWLEEADLGMLPDFYPLAGFVRIGFTRAFYHLLEQDSFEDALTQTLVGGGDTDTNACIVGAMIGALHGLQGIPRHMVDGVVSSDTSLGHLRPEWLTATDGLALAASLLD